MNHRLDARLRLVASALLVTGIANTIVYAVMIAQGYSLAPGHPDAFRDLQRAMTWSDGYMTILSLAGAAGLWMDRWWGKPLALAGAAALVYMGVLDVAFLAQHDMYAKLDRVVLVMLTIDTWAIGVGGWIVFTVAKTWPHQEQHLLPQDRRPGRR